jgi:hypothetical protein
MEELPEREDLEELADLEDLADFDVWRLLSTRLDDLSRHTEVRRHSGLFETHTKSA